MPLKTDMHAIKKIAKMLIYLDFKLTEFSPVVISHPFTDSSFVAFQTKGETQFVNLLEDKDGLAKWQDHLVRFVDEAASVWDIYRLLTKSYSLTFIKLTEEYLSKEDLSKLLRDTWLRIEFVTGNPVFTKPQLIRLFRKCDPSSLMSKEEYKVYRSLPDCVDIYRGIRKGSNKVKGMSWTTDIEVAKWFSQRFTDGHNMGDVYKASIRKSDILAYFEGANESEIVVNTQGLRMIEKLGEKALNTCCQKPTLDDVVEGASARQKKKTASSFFQEKDRSF